MANFSNISNTGNNPDEWFTSSYQFTPTTDVISLDLTSAMSVTGVTDADLSETQGDVRSVYLALAEALWQAYDAKDDNPDTTSGRLKMTRSQVVDSNANIRYSTYTIHVQESGSASGGSSYSAPNFFTTGVAPE